MKKTVVDWVKSCEECQKRSSKLPKEEGFFTGEPTLFGRVSLDVVHIKASQWKYLVLARDDLSGWVEGAALKKLTAKGIKDFFFENWICRYGAIKKVTVEQWSSLLPDLYLNRFLILNL